MNTITPDEVKAILVAVFPDATVNVEDLTGTQDHYKATIITPSFEGKMLIDRHRMVNEALREPLKGPIHALTIEAYTPVQWQAQTSPTPKSISY